MAIPKGWSARFQGGNGLVTSAIDVRAICPHCGNASTFSIQSHFFVPNYPSGTLVHLILECNYASCRKIVYVFKSVPPNLGQNPDDSFYMYPSGAIGPPHPAIPAPIADDWIEAQTALHTSAPKAAAVMFRRVLYGVLIDKGCKLHPLREGLAELIQSQRLPAIFDEWLPAIRDDGHDAAHPDRALQVSAENVGETMEYTAELLRFLYIEPYEFQQRKSRNLGQVAVAGTGP